MPNGRSGGFTIEKADLRDLIKNTGDAVVGNAFVGLLGQEELKPREIYAEECFRLVDECAWDRIAVEEQHRDSYLLHFSNAPKLVWLLVGNSRVLFAGLRERHQRFILENPGWDGWIGF